MITHEVKGVFTWSNNFAKCAKWLYFEASIVLNVQSVWTSLLVLLQCPAVAVHSFFFFFFFPASHLKPECELIWSQCSELISCFVPTGPTV